MTPLGLLIAPHDNRPLDLRPDAWANNPTAWLWGHAFRFLPSVVEVKQSLASGKLGAPGLAGAAGSPIPRAGAAADAMSALANLGFKPAEASAAVAAANEELGPDATLDALVRLALRKAAK